MKISSLPESLHRSSQVLLTMIIAQWEGLKLSSARSTICRVLSARRHHREFVFRTGYVKSIRFQVPSRFRFKSLSCWARQERVTLLLCYYFFVCYWKLKKTHSEKWFLSASRQLSLAPSFLVTVHIWPKIFQLCSICTLFAYEISALSSDSLIHRRWQSGLMHLFHTHTLSGPSESCEF